MSNFEKIYIDGKPQEKLHSIEKPYCGKLVYRPPHLQGDIMDESTPLGQKYKKALELCKEAKVTDVEYKGPPLIPMKLDMPILEEQIKKLGMHPDEKSKSKITKKKPAKNNKKALTAAVAKV